MIPDGDAPEILRFHKFLLGDTGPRLALFQKAIAARIRPGDVVVDLGSGTGVLAFFACRAHARRVYAIEESPAIELASLLASRNGVGDRIVCIRGRSDDVQLPERADAIIADIFGTFGLARGALGRFVDARQRFLKPGGVMLPDIVNLFAVPVAAPDLYAEHVGFWSDRAHGIDWSVVQPFAANNRFPVRLDETAFVADPAEIAEIDVLHATNASIAGTATFALTRGGLVHGFCGWFSARLADGIWLTNRPGASVTNYSQTFFPLGQAIAVEPGDLMTLRMQGHDGHHWHWCGSVRRYRSSTADAAVEFDHATLSGFPASSSSFEKK